MLKPNLKTKTNVKTKTQNQNSKTSFGFGAPLRAIKIIFVDNYIVRS